jgi:putative MATE family efflux protein
MGMAEDVTRESIRYLRVIFLGLPLMFLPPVLDSVFRARGDTRTPLLLHVIGVGTNVVGNTIAVFVLDAGTVGIAAATLLSRLVWVAVALVEIRGGRIGIQLRRREGKLLDLGIWWRIAKISAPIAARAFLFGSIYQMVSRITSDFGSAAQNGLGVGIRLEGLCFFILVGFGMAAGPLVGQNLGAGKPDRAERAAWITAGMACIPAAVFSLFFYFGPNFLMDLMTGDPGSRAHGIDYLRIVSICMVFTALEVVLAQGFVGAGDTLPPAVVDIPTTAARVPLAAWLSSFPALGVYGIWWTIAGTAIARGVLMALWFKRGKWKRARPDLDK